MTTPLSNADDTAEYIKLRTTKDPIEAFNLFIKRNVDPSLHAHFDDCDDNEAEYVRRTITTHAEQVATAARIDAYADCGSKGGNDAEVRAYAKSRADGLAELQTPKPPRRKP